MRKLLVLAFKEVRLAFRDVGAILTMLVTPLALTLAIAAAFGGGGSVPIADIPVLVLNQDAGQMSGTLVEALLSDQLADLLEPEVVTDEAAARARVEADQVAALVVIPPDFSARLLPMGGTELRVENEGSPFQLTAEQMQAWANSPQAADAEELPTVIEIYASPQWRISTAVVKAVVAQILERMHLVVRGIGSTMGRLILAGGVDAMNQEQLLRVGQGIGEQLVQGAGTGEALLRLEVVSTRRAFSWLDYSAASMAILFLMFSATSGGRTLLIEREGGTLPRLLVSPTPAVTILVGKMAGVALTGILQVAILWGASSLIGAYWGEPLAVFVTIVALVLAATGVGALIAAWAKSPQQAGAIGTAVTLVAAALSGSFFPRMNLPAWVRQISLLTPNAWGIELFADLQAGDALGNVLPMLGGLLLLTLAYYVVALIGFRRQFE